MFFPEIIEALISFRPPVHPVRLHHITNETGGTDILPNGSRIYWGESAYFWVLRPGETKAHCYGGYSEDELKEVPHDISRWLDAHNKGTLLHVSQRGMTADEEQEWEDHYGS